MINTAIIDAGPLFQDINGLGDISLIHIDLYDGEVGSTRPVAPRGVESGGGATGPCMEHFRIGEGKRENAGMNPP